MMRSIRTAVCLTAIGVCCVSLLFVFSKSGSSEEAKKAGPRIRDLQQKRLVVLEKVCKAAEAIQGNASGSYAEVFAAKAALAAAQIEYAETRQDRIKACDEAVKNALDMQDLAHERAKVPGGAPFDELKADAYVLETQIRREKVAAE
jgi:hypothetical protein